MSNQSELTYTETDKAGQEVVRFKQTKDKVVLKKQLDEFEKLAKSGKVVCLSDLMCNAGM